MMIKQFPAIKQSVITGTLILAAILTSFASAASAQTLNAASNAAGASPHGRSIQAAAPAAGRSYCVSDYIMDNVPRGSQTAVPWTLCVVGDGKGDYRAQVNITPIHRVQLAARLHVELSYGSRALANTREYVTPYVPITIATGWVHWGSHGTYCATFWNHDGLGYYVIGERACGKF